MYLAILTKTIAIRNGQPLGTTAVKAKTFHSLESAALWLPKMSPEENKTVLYLKDDGITRELTDKENARLEKLTPFTPRRDIPTQKGYDYSWGKVPPS
jgi:hypothetical protein